MKNNTTLGNSLDLFMIFKKKLTIFKNFTNGHYIRLNTISFMSKQKEFAKTKERMKKVIEAEKSQDSFPST